MTGILLAILLFVGLADRLLPCSMPKIIYNFLFLCVGGSMAFSFICMNTMTSARFLW